MGVRNFQRVGLLFVSANWWTSKTNYERDKDALKQQVELLQKQLDLEQKDSIESNVRKFSDLKLEAGWSLLSISNNLQSKLFTIQQTNDAKWFNVATHFTNFGLKFAAQLTNDGMKMLELITNTLTTMDASTRHELNLSITNAENKINFAIAYMNTNIEVAIDGAMGVSLMAQGELQLKNKVSRRMELHAASKSYLTAAHLLFIGKDGMNLRRCITTFSTICIPTIMAGTTKEQFRNL